MNTDGSSTAWMCHLNIARWQPSSSVNGPGQRFVLWLQGCPIHCPGCINPEMQPLIRKQWLRVEDVARRILAVPGIEGVTYTGGEPFRQAAALTLLSERLVNRGLSIVCYSGYQLDELRRRPSPWISRLLGCTDILIDGRYLMEHAASLLWRGSRNQQVHFLTDRYASWRGHATSAPAQVEIRIGRQGFEMTGTWPAGLLQDLGRALQGDSSNPAHCREESLSENPLSN